MKQETSNAKSGAAVAYSAGFGCCGKTAIKPCKELKPCPFCLGEACLHRRRSVNNAVAHEKNGWVYHVHCTDCGAHFPEDGNEPSAISRWNSREKPNDQSHPLKPTCRAIGASACEICTAPTTTMRTGGTCAVRNSRRPSTSTMHDRPWRRALAAASPNAVPASGRLASSAARIRRTSPLAGSVTSSAGRRAAEIDPFCLAVARRDAAFIAEPHDVAALYRHRGVNAVFLFAGDESGVRIKLHNLIPFTSKMGSM